MGKCFFYNGDFYAGPWKNDKMDTTFDFQGLIHHAILIQKDGLYRYFGQFKDNLKSGRGVEY